MLAPFEIVLRKNDAGLWRGEVEIPGVLPQYAQAEGLGTTGEAAEAFAQMSVLAQLAGLVVAGEVLPPKVEELLAGDLAVRRARLVELQRLGRLLGAGEPLPAPWSALFTRKIP
jgi:hypothetical protein